MPFEALFVPDDLRAAVSDDAWVRALVEAERALRVAVADVGLAPPGELPDVPVDADLLAEEGRAAGNPVEPLARLLREHDEHAHFGATSQDVMDTAAALVARDAIELIVAELDGVGAECARLAEEHRGTVMAARTLLQQAVPTTFGLKAAGWLVAVVDVRNELSRARLPAQLGGAGGTLAAYGDRGLDVVAAFAKRLRLEEPSLPWHANRVPLARLAGALAVAAGACAKVALDLELLAQTEVAEVREGGAGVSSTMPHKRNPIRSIRARACARGAIAAAGVLTSGEHEHERAAGAWHAEWHALSDALALTGGAAAAVREALSSLEVDAERMRANMSDETLSEARRLGIDAAAPADYLGSADALIDRALERYRR